MNSPTGRFARDYERWLAAFGADFPEDVPCTVSAGDVLRAHYLLCDYFLAEGEDISLAGPRDSHLLPSAIGRQFVEYEGHRKYSDPFDIAATLFFGLVKNHPFHDGNKRTAFLIAAYQLLLNNRMLDSKYRTWEELAVRTAEGDLPSYMRYAKVARSRRDPEVAFIADFFRRNTRRVDKAFYVVTFAQLKSRLIEFGFDLDEQGPNSIHLMRLKQVKRGPVFNRRVETERKAIRKIGFHGWSAEVSKADIKAVREATGLTLTKDVDSKVFFQGVDQLEALIPKYHQVLVRLRDK